MSRKRSLALVTQPQGYFHELVTAAIKSQKVKTRPETEFYLVNLLNQFMLTDNLYTRDGNGNAYEEPLALMLKEALEQPNPEQQKSLFRHVGDVSLYTAGYFQESLNRKLVDVSYYIGMGNAAYRHAAARTAEDLFRAIFQELADQFSRFVEVFAEVSEKTTEPKTEKDLLRIYEHWVNTKSERSAKKLKQAGILPNNTIKKKLQ